MSCDFGKQRNKITFRFGTKTLHILPDVFSFPSPAPFLPRMRTRKNTDGCRTGTDLNRNGTDLNRNACTDLNRNACTDLYLYTIIVTEICYNNSLYTNIPQDEGTDACLEAIGLAEASHIPLSVLLELFNIVLKCNVFSFNNSIYQQIQGTAMGTRIPLICKPVHGQARENLPCPRTHPASSLETLHRRHPLHLDGI